MVFPMSLGDFPHSVLRVWGGGGACGATGNCEIALFDRETQRMLLSANGWEFRILSASHSGLHDVQVRQNMGCCSGIRYVYRFEGRSYRLAKQVDEVTSTP